MMRKMMFMVCVMFFGLQISAHGEYADPLKNPWILTLEEHWPGTEPIKGNGMTFRLKVPMGYSDQTVFDIWQMDIPKGTSSSLVLHPASFAEDDPSFNAAQAAIYKTGVVVQGEVEVYFSNCKTPYVAKQRDTIHLMPGTPHKFKALKDAVLMIYCYGEGVSKDQDKNFVKAYFDKAAADQFTVSPRDEDLACNEDLMGKNILVSYDFTGPNNEIRPSRKTGSITSRLDMNPFSDIFLKVATHETNDQMEFLEYAFITSLDYQPHEHRVLVESMVMTAKEATFWVGRGRENGTIDVCHPDYGADHPDSEPGDGIKHPANAARNGDGVRVKPGYVIYIPPGVPHSMLDTEDGNIWILTTNPLGRQTEETGQRPDRLYDAKSERPVT